MVTAGAQVVSCLFSWWTLNAIPPQKKTWFAQAKAKKKNTPIFLLKTSEGETICIGFLDTEVICHRTSHRTSSSNVVIRSSIWIGTNVKMWRICLGILKARGYRKISQMFKSNLLIGEIKDPVNFCEGIDRKQGCQQSCWQKKTYPPGSLTARPWKSYQNPTGKESSFLSQGRAVKLRGSMLQSRAKASPPTRIQCIYIYVNIYINIYVKHPMGNPQLPPKHLAVRHHLHQWEEH